MKYAPLVGRILFALIFLMFGLNHLTDTQGMIERGMVPDFLPLKSVVVILTGIVIILGGLSVLLGYNAKLGGLVLFVFLLPTALLTWGGGFIEGDPTMTAMFLKDLALSGAALLIYHNGSGPFSLDARSTSSG